MSRALCRQYDRLTISVVLQLCWFVGSHKLVEHDSYGKHIDFCPDEAVLRANLGCDVSLRSAPRDHHCLSALGRLADV